jgi:diaminohydroxyphosphoribosylaminopyrimidine deaminase / 5-amino-6-(5-phosphoribosylamino)uracil reductase
MQLTPTPDCFGKGAHAHAGVALPELLERLGEQARAFRFEVAPNPCVGAAVLSAGRVIGCGFHGRWGGPHAEVEALAAAAKSGVPKERWDTLVVTLEPCSSTGKTPPCTQAILQSGIRRVVVGALDPDPRHGGHGLTVLRDAGLDVEFIPARPGMHGSWALEDIARHFTDWNSVERLRRPRPWLIAKWAQTLTGQLSPPENVGEGRWISGPASLDEVHRLRGQVDAILTGVGTVRADDPRLSVRLPGDTTRAPMRVILDSYLTTSPDARLFQDPEPAYDTAENRLENQGPVYLLCKSGPDAGRYRALEAVGARIVTMPGSDDGRISLRATTDWLWNQGVRRALLEAGPILTRAFHDAELLDQVRVYSGNVVGGRGQTLAPLIHELIDRDRLIRSRLDRESGDGPQREFGDAVIELFS